MPFSVNVFDTLISEVIKVLKPSRLCDIGPGAGKYGKITHEAEQKNSFKTKLTCIEIDPIYVDQFGLRSIYDEVIIDDAINLIGRLDIKYDLVIIGDVIEHIRKSDALDLLNFLIYRVSYICIIFPEEYIQEGTMDHPREAHISTWAIEDFHAWEILHTTGGYMNVVLIKGYQSAHETVEWELKKLFGYGLTKRALKLFIKRLFRFLTTSIGIDPDKLLIKLKIR